MSDYTNLLRMLKTYEDGYGLYQDAAAAIEALQKDLAALQKCYEIADTTADEVLKQLPKRGKWVELEDRNERKYSHICSVCHHFNIAEGEVEFYHYCPNCGAKMEVQE